MTDKIKLHDFIELNYTGKLADGTIFDTTEEKTAKENNLPRENRTFSPAIICVGEKQILPGLDDKLIDKEIGNEYVIELKPEEAFGKRDIKKIKIVPISTFKEHKVQPQPGLQIDVDGEFGTIKSVSGGRIIVNFNHPLAGKEIIYTLKINRRITDEKEKAVAFLYATLQIPKKDIKVEDKEGKVLVTLPFDLPQPVTDALAKKLAEIAAIKDISFQKETKQSIAKDIIN